uniref:Ig-like domain-containing protein n=1 Tax=Ciona savignyi TaxID=51511 RepID=H2ZQU9_CIOSA
MLLSHTSIKVKLGATARLACPAIGSPPPVIRWLKSGRELYFNNSRISRRSNDLIISNVKQSDVGRYACVASNSASREKRLNLRLILTGRIIRFRVKPQNTTVTKGRQVKLRCRIRGGPATISWSKDGDPIHTDNHYVVKSWGDLRILRSQISDSGNYSCMVSTKGNKLTTLQASAVVKVLPKPTMEECKDLPFYANCRLVAAASMCRHQHYKRYCCVTCKQKKLLS